MTTRREDEDRSGAGRGGREAVGIIEIEASPERVWRALTEAQELERWFPLEARVEPGEGGTMHLSWKNEFVGELEILSWDPPRHLRTGWAFHAHDRDHLQVTDYYVTGQGGTTRVRVVTSGFPDDPSWDAWVEGTVRGWRFELRALKHYLERHAGRNRQVVYLRRRSELAAAKLWNRLFPEAGPALSAVSGEVFDEVAERQYAAVTSQPPGAILRVSLEPAGMGSDQSDVTVFLSCWDCEDGAVRALEQRWRNELAALVPEGEEL